MNNIRNITKLKIKIKHLAKEPAIIRLEEKKARAKYKKGLAWAKRQKNFRGAKTEVLIMSTWAAEDFKEHRETVVRDESRATQLAYAYLRGKKYHKTERPNDAIWSHNYSTRIYKRLVDMVERYDGVATKREDIEKDIQKWLGE